VALLIASVVGIAILSLLGVPPARLEAQVISLISAVPTALFGLWRLLIGLLAGWALLVAVGTLVRRRWGLLLDLLLSSLLVFGLGLLIGRLVHGSWTIAWNEPDGDPPWAPWVKLTLPAAAVLVANPHLTLSVRRFGWWLIVLATGAVMMLGASAPTLAVTSLLVATASAAIVHLALGSPRGHPDLDQVTGDLAALGVTVDRLGTASRQRAGVFLLEAEDVEGRRLDVKVYGRDAYDTQWLTTVWRMVWFRRPGAPVSPGRLAQVEHEALMTLLAGQTGALTQPVVTAALAPNEDAVLVLEKVGEPLSSRDLDEPSASRLWEMVGRLHEAGITHGQIDAEHLLHDGPRLGLIDFLGARVSPDPWHRRIDQAQTLVTTVVALGPGPALALAFDRLGAEEMGAVLPFLQEDPLTPSQRGALDAAAINLETLRDEAATVLGVEPPELEQLRRVTWSSLIRLGLPILAFLALARLFAGLDPSDLGQSLADASWWYLAVGLLLAQVPRISQAISALGASPIAVPLDRLVQLQLAQAYIGLTIPGAPARIALNTRFFQRQGLPAGSALTVGALDSFAGFLSQILLLSLVLVFSSVTLDLDLDSDTTSGLVRMLAVVVIAVLVIAVLVIAIPSLRRPVFYRVRGLWEEAMSAVRGLGSPRRLAMLLGGNVSSELVLALALGGFAVALGEPIGYPELLFINITVSLFSGLVPIPGGIGVAEGALVFGLARAGMPEAAAFAAAILYRAATFYLPPVWGWFAFRSLERNRHL
jgi:uncharacterized membrane protein YbhN (UPF0104 family)